MTITVPVVVTDDEAVFLLGDVVNDNWVQPGQSVGPFTAADILAEYATVDPEELEARFAPAEYVAAARDLAGVR